MSFSYCKLRSFSHSIRHSNNNSTLCAFLQANSCTSVSKFCFRNRLLSILISDKWFKRCYDIDDLSSFFVRFSFENDHSPQQFDHTKIYTQNNSNVSKSDIMHVSLIRRCIHASRDLSPFFVVRASCLCPQLGRTKSRGRCWVVIKLSHQPESSGHVLHAEVDGSDDQQKRWAFACERR